MPRESAGAGWIRATMGVYCLVAAGTGAEAFMSGLKLGFGAVVERAQFITSVVGAGAGATRTFNVKKGSVVLFSGAVALADTAAKGQQKDLAAQATNAPWLDGDTLTVDVSSGGTSFTTLEGFVYITYRQRLQQQG